MSPWNVSVATVLLVAVFLVAVWLAPMNTISVLAFAEVQGQIEKTKSVQYTETRQDQTPDGSKSGPKIETRVMILGRYLKRDDRRALTPGDKLEEGAMWTQGPGHIISIFDAKAGKNLVLLPETKQFSRTQGTASISPDDGSIEIEKMTPLPGADFYEQFRRLRGDKAEKLAERVIDGKRTLGFRFVEKTERKRGTDTFTRDFWVDPTTKLPLRLEVSFRSTIPKMGRSNWILSDFIWDSRLDQSLFSTDPPEGYVEMK